MTVDFRADEYTEDSKSPGPNHNNFPILLRSNGAIDAFSLPLFHSCISVLAVAGKGGDSFVFSRSSAFFCDAAAAFWLSVSCCDRSSFALCRLVMESKYLSAQPFRPATLPDALKARKQITMKLR